MGAYANRYANLTAVQCDREASLLMQECVNGRRKWEDVSDRLVALRRVKSYAPAPFGPSLEQARRLSIPAEEQAANAQIRACGGRPGDVLAGPLRSLLTPAEELAGLD